MSAVAFPDDFDDFERTHARANDPDTSRRGARDVALRAGTQKAKLLLAYAAHPGRAMTWSMARDMTDLGPRSCAWHRVGDLAEDGLLELVKINGIVLTMPGDLGSDQRCFVITEEGLRKARELSKQ